MFHPTATLIPILLMLLACQGAEAQALRDSGYGDGSLVDAHGQYYYPQSGGGYLDSYGSSYEPSGDGTFSDAIGNTIDARATGAPSVPSAQGRRGAVSGDPDADFEQRRGPAALGDDPLPTVEGEDAALGLSSDAAEAPRKDTGTRPRGDALGAADDSPGGGEAFGSMYLKEAGDGYTKIDADGVSEDPRSAKPPDRADSAKTQADQRGPSGNPALSDLDVAPRPSAPGNTDQRHLPAIDLSPVERKYDDSARFKGTSTR
ncbi:MAG TPA: hypothetical protein VES73_17535 [Lamprocystis sp. (in: g-proteobacteria)]|nr:hypothetical protein [Lamprocystis sp. (in: g-proteobacteria)]